ncbi:MAG: hypothetical protein MI923_21815 [Phycisphaerales bacterium]|nr:hypothetical protein [Phycisphaerales bacterium]
MTIRAAPPLTEDVAGVYVGQMNDGPETWCRLELNPDKTGLFACCSTWDRKLRLYEVRDWDLDERNIRINLDSISTASHLAPICLRGKAYRSSLELEARFRKYGDSQDRFFLKMRREKEVARQLSELKRGMESVALTRATIPVLVSGHDGSKTGAQTVAP